MNVWLIKDGENLPIQTDARPMRMWMLADRLVDRGHRVLWWHSTFSHQTRQLLAPADSRLLVRPGFELSLVHANTYRRNVSWARYRHHQVVARRFLEMAATSQPPDVIVCAFPTIELAHAAAQFSESRRIPLLIDVRDLWPDLIVHKSPRALRPFVYPALVGMRWQQQAALRAATALAATSEDYLEWALARCGRESTDKDRVFYLGAEPPPSGSALVRQPVQDILDRLQDKVIFTYIGSFGKSYELNLVAEVAARLQRERPEFHFVLAGDGEQFEQIARQQLPNLTLTGWLTQQSLQPLLQRTDVGLVPCISVAGTVPNKIFDYLAAGIPIISSLTGETSRLIDRHHIGFSYSVGSRSGLTQHVLELGSNTDLRQRQSANARIAYATCFNADTIYTSYAEHVETVALAS